MQEENNVSVATANANRCYVYKFILIYSLCPDISINFRGFTRAAPSYQAQVPQKSTGELTWG